MFTLDSDLLGLLMALLTFFIPVITSIMEKRKKKRKEEISALQRSGEEYGEQEGNNDVLPDESLHNRHKQALQAEEEESHTTAASELEELFNDILGLNVQQHNVSDGDTRSPEDDLEKVKEPVEDKLEEIVGKKENGEKFLEGVAATVQANEPVASVGEDILNEIPQEDKGLKKRIKENPKDMVIFAEILKPKFKEY